MRPFLSVDLLNHERHPVVLIVEVAGKLTLDGSDKWWRVYGDVEVAAVIAVVLADVHEYAMPWCAEQMRARGCQ
jgi:hypothetical protein